MADIYNPTNNLKDQDTILKGSSKTTATDSAKSLQADNHTKNVFVFIKHKIEKLSTAVYMVSSYMPHEEPVRTSLRVLALSSVGHSGHLSFRQVSTHFNDLEKDIEQLLSLIRLSRTLDMITNMNANILETEYQKVLSILQKQKDNGRTFLTPLGTTFDDYYKSSARQVENSAATHDAGGTLLEKVLSPIVSGLPTDTQQPRVVREVVVAPKQKKFIPLVENKERRSVRQEQVLKVLQTDAEMSIKDITNKVRGCSEKTIQRELSELLDQKKIVRIGDKRWSRYLKLSL
jgi:hypothetical protein